MRDKWAASIRGSRFAASDLRSLLEKVTTRRMSVRGDASVAKSPG